MIPVEAVIAQFPELETVELTAWIERGWVEPDTAEAGGWIFHAIDVARIRLIYDLRRELGVAEDTVPLILSLLDQIYELRGQLKAVTRAVSALPEPLQAQVLAALESPPDAG